MKFWILWKWILSFTFLLQITARNLCEEQPGCYCTGSNSSFISLYCDLNDNVTFDFNFGDIENIRHLSVKGQSIRINPNKYGNIYPRLETLALEGSSKETILTKSFLNQFPNLGTLRIKDCGIIGADRGLLSVLLYVHSIDLSGNRRFGFQAVTKAFEGFRSKNLRLLNLSLIHVDDSLSEGVVPYSLFKHLEETPLENLDISWNRIVYLQASFAYLQKIQYFNMSGTSLLGDFDCLSTLIKAKHFLELVVDFWPTFTRGIDVPGTKFPRHKHKRSDECIAVSTISDNGCYNLGESARTLQMQHSRMSSVYVNLAEQTCYEPNRIVNFLVANNILENSVNEVRGLHLLEVADLSYPDYQSDSIFPGIVNTTFVDMPSLKKLLIPGNRLYLFSMKELRNLFINCHKLQLIDISSNNFTDLPDDLFRNNLLLEHINISNNNLATFPLNLSNLKNLNYLDLSFNNFKHLDQAFITNEIWNANSIVLNLMYNHFDCDCSINEVLSMNASDLQISCQKKRNIRIIQRNSSLGTSPFLTCEEESRGFKNDLVIVGSVCGFISVAAIFFIICCCMRRKTKMSNTSHSVGNEPFVHFIRVSEEPRNRRNIVFLAFIAYSHHDQEFVCNTLYPRLNSTLRNLMPDHCENSVLTLYDKHFLPGDDIDLACEQAILQSYVTIAIVSQSFLESSWCSYEIKTAMHERIPLIPLYLEQCDPSKLKGIFKNMFNCKVRMEWPTKGTSQDEEERVISRLGRAICANVSAMKPNDHIAS